MKFKNSNILDCKHRLKMSFTSHSWGEYVSARKILTIWIDCLYLLVCKIISI